MADSKKDDWVTGAFIGIGLAGLGIGGGLAAASASLGPPAIAVWGFAMVMVMAVMKSSIAEAFAKRLSEGGTDDPELADSVYAELDELRSRVLELEERQDFSERMLTNKEREAKSE